MTTTESELDVRRDEARAYREAADSARRAARLLDDLEASAVGGLTQTGCEAWASAFASLVAAKHTLKSTRGDSE